MRQSDMVVAKQHENVAQDTFRARMAEDASAVLLDVRTQAEFRSERIPDAINIDVTDDGFAESIAALDKNKTYYVYCRSGGRSNHACAIMTAQGLTAINLLGGISCWRGEVI
jgi:rhodanese-related sulfurtransferase